MAMHGNWEITIYIGNACLPHSLQPHFTTCLVVRLTHSLQPCNITSSYQAKASKCQTKSSRRVIIHQQMPTIICRDCLRRSVPPSDQHTLETHVLVLLAFAPKYTACIFFTFNAQSPPLRIRANANLGTPHCLGSHVLHPVHQ